MRYILNVITLSTLLSLLSCNPYANIDFRQEMRGLVTAISSTARSTDPDFIVIPQNGIELISSSVDAIIPDQTYLDAIQAVGQEDLYYGYDNDNTLTPAPVITHLLPYLHTCTNNNVKVLVTDYCSVTAKMSNSYVWNQEQGFISFAADHRGLDNIPSYPAQPHLVHSGDVTNILQADNFLYVLDSAAFASQTDYISSLSNNNYDLIIMDLSYQGQILSSGDIQNLRYKINGGKRLLIAYMSIGEAENYRYYWNSSWSTSPPDWIERENPDWAGNFKVRYWEQDWKDIIYSGTDSYLSRIQAAGFDGVYLDIIDAFEYFEAL